MCIQIEEVFTFSLDGKKVIDEIAELDNKSIRLSNQLKLTLKNSELLNVDSKGNQKENNGLMTIFLLGFIGGFLALLTPCVFPMIPLTVSFFTK